MAVMHEGHRQRMYEKLLAGDNLYDHEVLEILLFNAFTRQNTNPLAHRLLDTFGTLGDIFQADPKALMQVEGVGKSCALYLKCVGECIARIDRAATGIIYLKSYEDFKRFTALRLRNKSSEMLEFYLTEKSGKVARVYSYTDKDPSKVNINTDEIAGVLSANKPYGLLVAHNHLSGNSTPSDADDRFTMEMQVLCSVNNVCLLDHCIYAGDNNIYSYFTTGRIDEIKRLFNFKYLVDAQYKTGYQDSIRNKK